jgi:hypothetical protein
MSTPTHEEIKRIQYLKMIIRRCAHAYYCISDGSDQPPPDYIFDGLELELAHYFKKYPIYFGPDYELPSGDRGAFEYEEFLNAHPLARETQRPLEDIIVFNSDFTPERY